MNTVNKSFFIDAISDEVSDEVAGNFAADSLDDLSESRDTRHGQPTIVHDTTIETGSIKLITAPGQICDQAQEHKAPPRATLIFAVGEDRFSDSCELGVLNEHPEPLKTITSNPCLNTSAFLNPALHAVMAELRPSMMVQVAVRLSAISLRLVAEVLPSQNPLPQHEGPGKDERQGLAETIGRKLDQAVPYYEWQGSRNCHGRVKYLMALLEEAIRVLTVPTESLTKALKLELAATRAAQRVA